MRKSESAEAGLRTEISRPITSAPPALDDIALRHRQARKAASRAVEWKQPERQQNVSAPMATDAPDTPGE